MNNRHSVMKTRLNNRTRRVARKRVAPRNLERHNRRTLPRISCASRILICIVATRIAQTPINKYRAARLFAASLAYAHHRTLFSRLINSARGALARRYLSTAVIGNQHYQICVARRRHAPQLTLKRRAHRHVS